MAVAGLMRAVDLDFHIDVTSAAKKTIEALEIECRSESSQVGISIHLFDSRPSKSGASCSFHNLAMLQQREDSERSMRCIHAGIYIHSRLNLLHTGSLEVCRQAGVEICFLHSGFSKMRSVYGLLICLLQRTSCFPTLSFVSLHV